MLLGTRCFKPYYSPYKCNRYYTISSDNYGIQFDVILYPQAFFGNTPLKYILIYDILITSDLVKTILQNAGNQVKNKDCKNSLQSSLKPHPFQVTLSSVQCPVSSVQCPLSSVQCPVYSVQCPVYSVQSPVYSVQCPVYSVQCTVSSV